MRKNRAKKNTTAVLIDNKLLNQLSETASLSERNASIAFFAGEGEETKVEIFTKHQDLVRQKRAAGVQITPEVSFGCFVMSCKIAHREDRVLSVKRGVSIEEADALSKKRAERFKQQKRSKGALKFELVRKRFYHKILALRTEHGYSWAEVAAYLARHEKFDITRAHLRDCCMTIEKELGLKERQESAHGAE